MSSEVYLTVKPREVQFVAELSNLLKSPLQLSNNTDNHVAFKVMTTNPKKYTIRPNHGVVMAWSTCDITVTMQPQKEFPKDLQCKDKFLIQSAITSSGDIDLHMFDKDSAGYDIQECKLRAVYIDPRRFSSPIAEGSEVSYSSTPVSNSENSITSDLTSVMKPTNARSGSIENLLHELATNKLRQFSHEDIIKFTSNRAIELGSGAFGNVYKGQFDSVEIAVKILKENEIIKEVFMAEVNTMGRTYHRNLVKLYGFCFDDSMKALVYEYASNGSLDHVLFANRFDLKWEKLYNIAIDTAKALVCLHDGCDHTIIHHDIKPANVLLDISFSPKITDFGLAKLMSKNLSHLTMSGFRGTPTYTAPETFYPFSKVTSKCDVYSFGIMLLEIFGRRKNVTEEALFPEIVWEKFESGQLDELIIECGITVENKKKARILCRVALWCIQFTPETRPTMNLVSIMLEKEIQVTRPPNPFLTSPSNFSMQPSQSSQEIIYSDISSSISSIHL